MNALLAYVEAGIVSGSIYALIAIGMNLLLVVSGVMQFAYGEVVVLSMYLAWLVHGATGSVALAFAAAVMTSLGVTTLVEPLVRTLRERRLVVETMITTIALGMILTEIMAHYLNAGLPIAFPPTLVGGGWDISFGLVRIAGADVYAVIATFVLLAVLVWFLFHTRLGKALRAMAHDIQIARLIGIPLQRGTLLSFLIAGLLSGVTAILFTLTIGAASPDLGAQVTFKGMAVMLLGGMGSLRGAVAGGYVLGVIEALVKGYFIGDWVDAIAMGFIMAVIVLRPGGLFGTTAHAR